MRKFCEKSSFLDFNVLEVELSSQIYSSLFFMKNTLFEKEKFERQKFEELKGDLNSKLKKYIFEYFALLFILKILH